MLSRRLPCRSQARGMAMTVGGISQTPRAAQPEGTIAFVFNSLSGSSPSLLLRRYSELKKEIWRDEMMESWRQVLVDLKITVEEVAAKGSDYSDLKKGLSEEQINAVRQTGTVVVKNGVAQEEALGWKQSIRDYVSLNRDRVRGFPADDIQVFELYNSKAQTAVRTHPALIATQKHLLGLWHASNSESGISLSTPIAYFDRLRIRQPGDATFALGPHIDGGSLERWEDPGFRSCFESIFKGGDTWRSHDSFDASPRLDTKVYSAAGQCSVFRPFQGWCSASNTGPGEGTLRTLPMMKLATSYIMLRPFFRPCSPSALRTPGEGLAFDDWKLDLESTEFPGAAVGKTQELNEITHPHLRLDKTMTSMPRVNPGDQVYWHCDVVHAVEGKHLGKGDSSVFYIPAIPLTLNNAYYLRDQRSNFLAGLPAPDFPGGEGESKFKGRASKDDVTHSAGRQLLGLERFTGNSKIIQEANTVLFP